MKLVRFPSSLLWIDCLGGLLVGVFVLTFVGWLSALYQLPPSLIVAMGIANLGYGTFSLSLTLRARRPLALIRLLAVANILWAVVCVIIAAVMASQASLVGLAFLSFEGAYVGGLGALEWRHRASLLVAA